jgi:hypothetical protein
MNTEQITANRPTAEGGKHEFEVHTPDTTWNAVGGICILAYSDTKSWWAVCVGETEDFSQGLPNHECWPEAKRAGATHIHARVEEQVATRQDLDQRLIQHLQPPLIEHSRQPRNAQAPFHSSNTCRFDWIAQTDPLPACRPAMPALASGPILSQFLTRWKATPS